MALSIYSNLAATDTQIRLGKSQDMVTKVMSQLSSGMRIATASDDPAGLGISVGFDTQVRSYHQAARNTNDGISMLQTAEGALSQTHGSLQRMRELALQSSNGTLSATERTNIQTEFTQLQNEIDRVANSTKFGSVSMLNAASTVTLQVGVNNSANDVVAVSVADATGTTLKVDSTAGITTITTVAGATAALDKLDTAIASVSGAHASLGAMQNRLKVAYANDLEFSKNLDAAVSRIRDVDVASAAADLARFNVLQQAGVSMLAQANQGPQAALSLLR